MYMNFLQRNIWEKLSLNEKKSNIKTIDSSWLKNSRLILLNIFIIFYAFFPPNYAIFLPPNYHIIQFITCVSLQNINSMTEKKIELNSYRYMNLAIFLLGALGNSLPAQAFSPITSILEEKFHYDPIIITLNSLFFPLVHPFMSLPIGLMLDRYGLKKSCSLGGVLLLIGVWLRSGMQEGDPMICLIGSLFSALGNAFLLNSVSVFANNWFSLSSVPHIISICVLCNIASVTIGATLSGLIISESSSVRQIKNYFQYQAIFITITVTLVILFLKDQPAHPPSRSAQARRSMSTKPYSKTIRSLLHNPEYLKIVFAMMFSYGVLISYISNLNQFFAVLGYSQPSLLVSTCTFSSTISGIIATLFFTWKVKQTKRYRLILSICISPDIVGLGVFFVLYVGEDVIFFQHLGGMLAVGLIETLEGCFRMPVISLFTAYASEVTFPNGEGSTTSYLFASSQIFGFALGMASISFLDKQNVETAYFLMSLHTALVLIAFVLNFLTKEDLRRTQFEEGLLVFKDQRLSSTLISVNQTEQTQE